MLNFPDQRLRIRAQGELVARQQVDALVQIARDRSIDRIPRLHALWGLGQLGEAGLSALAPVNLAWADSEEDEYRAQLPDLARVYQFPLFAPLANDHWFYGWADDVFFDGGVFTALEDRKFSGKPWDKNRVKYNYKQAQCYIWAMRHMGLDAKEMTFKVANYETPGIQSFVYKPRTKSVMNIPDWLNEAVAMRTQLTPPTGGHHCAFCNYQRECDDFLWPVS